MGAVEEGDDMENKAGSDNSRNNQISDFFQVVAAGKAGDDGGDKNRKSEGKIAKRKAGRRESGVLGD